MVFQTPSADRSWGRPNGRWRLPVALVAAAVVLLAAPPPAPASMIGGVLETIGNLTAQPGVREGSAAVAIQPDGNIVHVGITTVNGVEMISVIRVRRDGLSDPAFNDGRIVTIPLGTVSLANGVSIQPDGKILVAGVAALQNPSRLSMVAARLLPDGTPDPTFGHDGIVTPRVGDAALAMAIRPLPDGRILMGGTASSGGQNMMALHRMLPSGAPDLTFGHGGDVLVPTGLSPTPILPIPLVVPSGANGFALEPDGSAVLAGGATVDGAPAFAAARVTTAGALDPSFGSGGIATISVGDASGASAVEVQPDGKIVLSGASFQGVATFTTLRLNLDGRLDPAFGHGGVDTTEIAEGAGINGMALQPDGKIVLGGTTRINDSQFAAERLTKDGNPDPTFGHGGIVTTEAHSLGSVNGVAIQANGGIVMAGAERVSQNRTTFTLLRLDPSGHRTDWETITPAAIDASHPRVRFARGPLRATRHGGLAAIRIRNHNPWPVTGTLLLKSVDRGRPALGRRKAFEVPAARGLTVHIRLTASARRVLLSRDRLAARLLVAMRGPEGADVLRARTLSVRR